MLLIDAQRCLLNAQLLAFEGGIPDGWLLLVPLLASTTAISVSLEFETQSNISLLLSCKFDTPDGEFRRLQLQGNLRVRVPPAPACGCTRTRSVFSPEKLEPRVRTGAGAYGCG